MKYFRISYLLPIVISINLVASFPLTIFRLAGGNMEGYVNSMMMFSGLASLVLAISAMSRRRLDLFFAIYLVFICYILFLGTISEGLLEGIKGLRYFILGLVCWAGLLYYRDSDRLIQVFLSKKLWLAVLFSHLVGYTYYAILLKGTVYPGIGTQSIGYAAIYFFVSGPKLLFVVCTILLLVEGKRSLLLATSFALFMLVAMKSKQKRSTNMLTLLFYLIAWLIGTAFLLYLLAEINENLSDSTTTLARLDQINPFSSNFDVFLGSSGRAGEIQSFFGQYGLLESLVGLGSGFKYDWDLGYWSKFVENKGYFHMSILNYIATGGLLGILLWCFIFKIAYNGILNNSKSNAHRILIGFSTLSISQSFFGFNAAVDPFFWATLMMTAYASSIIPNAATNQTDSFVLRKR